MDTILPRPAISLSSCSDGTPGVERGPRPRREQIYFKRATSPAVDWSKHSLSSRASQPIARWKTTAGSFLRHSSRHGTPLDHSAHSAPSSLAETPPALRTSGGQVRAGVTHAHLPSLRLLRASNQHSPFMLYGLAAQRTIGGSLSLMRVFPECAFRPPDGDKGLAAGRRRGQDFQGAAGDVLVGRVVADQRAAAAARHDLGGLEESCRERAFPVRRCVALVRSRGAILSRSVRQQDMTNRSCRVRRCRKTLDKVWR